MRHPNKWALFNMWLDKVLKFFFFFSKIRNFDTPTKTGNFLLQSKS